MKHHIYLFLFTLPLLPACQNEKAEKAEAAGGKTPTVEVVQPKIRSFEAERSITGTAMANQSVLLHAMESGSVRNIRKDIGDRVQPGEIIAQLDNPMINQALSDAQGEHSRAQSGLSVAQADLASATANEKAKNAGYQRLQGIYQKTPQLTMLEEVERTRAQSEAASAEVLAAKARVSAAEAAQKAAAARLAVAKERKAMLDVKAPFGGLITQRLVDKGAMVQSGIANPNAGALVEVQDINPIRLRIPLPESDAAAIRVGMPATVVFPELGSNSFQVKISRTAGALDPASKTMQVEIDIPNPKGQIKPGMYAKVSLQLSGRANALSLPLEAQEIYKGSFFVLAVADNKVVRLPLRKGLSGKEFFEILNPEIQPETQVIVQGKSLVKPGQMVEPLLKKD